MKRKILIALILVLIFSGCYLFYLHLDPVIKIPRSDIETIRNDDIEKSASRIDSDIIHHIENIPIVYIKDSGYRAGFQHGKLLKQQIREVIRILDDDILKINTPKGLLADAYLLRKAKQLDGHIPQVYREEMKGVAEGAGVSYNDILLINTYDDLLYLTGCSSIAVPKSNKNELFFHARNLDYPISILSGKNIIFHYLDEQFISIGFPGYIGALSSTNYNGISLSSHTVKVRNNSTGIPTGILYRKISEEAKSIGDAELILNSSKRTIGNNLVVSSLKENEAITFEITPDGVNKIPSNDHAIATNHFASSESSEINRAASNSIKRYDYLENFFQNLNDTDADKIEEAMSYYDGNQNGWSSIANKGTVQSVIFLPEQKTIHVAKGKTTPVNMDGYAEYDYSQFIAE